MKIHKLNISDKKYFNKSLKLETHGLSSYAFENIFIWKKLFEIYWIKIEESLCIFFKDHAGCFMYLPPLSVQPSAKIIDEVFSIMDKMNNNKEISRIENAEERTLSFYKNLGYEYMPKSNDYVYKKEDLAQLKGDKFKSKRSSFNHFVKHYKFKYLPFSLKYKEECLKLYDFWSRQRGDKSQDSAYEYMLRDSKIALETMLKSYKYLDMVGRIVTVDSKFKAFTFGFELNHETFCILYEITDLSINGLAQFIFRQFSRELNYKYINTMDDSFLENIKKVKLSYRPSRLIPSYIIKRK